jgi:hypothetical protein
MACCVDDERRAGRCPDNAVLISLGMTKQVAQLCDEQLHVGRETNQPINGSLWVDKLGGDRTVRVVPKTRVRHGSTT